MLYLGLIVLLQIVCIAHVLMRGRHKGWICLIAFAPLIGSVVYLYTEVWAPTRPAAPVDTADPLRYRPAAVKPKSGKGLSRKGLTLLQGGPQAGGRVSDRVEASPEAAARLREALLVMPNDPALLYRLAEASYALGDHAQALEALNRLRATSEQVPSEARLLLARSYEAAGQPDKAQAAYEQALKSARHDLEIRCRYASFLQDQGQTAQAQAQFAEVRQLGEALPELSRKRNAAWIALAQDQASKPEPGVSQQFGPDAEGDSA